MKNIKLVVCDIDGTLVLDREPLSDEVISAIKGLVEMGIAFTFASGRLPYMIDPYFEVLGTKMPVVACNGAWVYDGHHILEKRLFPIVLTRELILVAESYQMTVLYAIEGQEYCAMETASTQKKRQERGCYHPVRELTEADWQELMVTKVNIMQGDSLVTMDVFASEKSRLKDSLLFTSYGTVGLEIVQVGVNKATGVRLVANELGLTLSQVMAIGDNENDAELLSAVGYSIAVGNATPEIKEIADYVCLADSAQGVSEALGLLLESREV